VPRKAFLLIRGGREALAYADAHGTWIHCLLDVGEFAAFGFFERHGAVILEETLALPDGLAGLGPNGHARAVLR
jgi:hypothetical protein